MKGHGLLMQANTNNRHAETREGRRINQSKGVTVFVHNLSSLLALLLRAHLRPVDGRHSDPKTPHLIDVHLNYGQRLMLTSELSGRSSCFDILCQACNRTQEHRHCQQSRAPIQCFDTSNPFTLILYNITIHWKTSGTVSAERNLYNKTGIRNRLLAALYCRIVHLPDHILYPLLYCFPNAQYLLNELAIVNTYCRTMPQSSKQRYAVSMSIVKRFQGYSK